MCRAARAAGRHDPRRRYVTLFQSLRDEKVTVPMRWFGISTLAVSALGAVLPGCGGHGEQAAANRCGTCDVAGGGGRAGASGSGTGGQTSSQGGAGEGIGAMGGGAMGGGPAGMAGKGGTGAPEQPMRLAAPSNVSDIVVNAGYVYYGDYDEDANQKTIGHLARVPVSGGTPTILAQATPS